MAANSNIEWTSATWNPCVGCESVSPGCARCYAATMTRRLEAMGQKDYAGLTTEKHFNGVVRCLPHKLDIPLKRRKPTTYFVNSMSDLFHEDVPDEFIDKVFAVMALAYRHTFQILTKRAKRMATYLENKDERVRKVWDAMGRTARYQIKGEKIQDIVPTLTGIATSLRGYDKHWPWSIGRNGYFANPPWPLCNVWLGVSCEDQKRAEERIPWLLKTPAAVRFLSCEPLLGAIDLTRIPTEHWAYGHVDVMSGYLCGSEPDEMHDYDADPGGWVRKPAREWERGECGVDWVIVGGESGGGARSCDISWVRSIVEQCKAAGVPVFVKQLGKNPLAISSLVTPNLSGGPGKNTIPLQLEDKKGGDPEEWPADLRVRQMPRDDRVTRPIDRSVRAEP